MAESNPLTRRESQILDLLAEGLSNDEIAARLNISPNTVKVHVRNIFEKMSVQSRTEATMEAVRRGWIEVPGVDLPKMETPAAPSWPPLALAWRPWYSLVLAAILITALLLTFWPTRSPALNLTGSPEFTTDLDLARTSTLPRQEAPRWSQRAAMPTARSRAAAALVGGRLFVVGGENQDGDTAALEMYDPELDIWQVLAARPLAARSAGAAGLDGSYYVAGGCAGETVLARVDRYDPETQVWTQVAPLPEARCGLALVSLDGKLYAIGGWDGDHVTDTLFIYDPDTDQWEEGRRLPSARAFHSAVALHGMLYAMGGHDDMQPRSEMWVYDPLADTWSPLPALPEARSGLAVAAEGTSIYVIGGGEDGEPHLHERYDILTKNWSTIDSPLLGPWHHAVAAMIGPNLYVIGGWGGDYLAINEVYQASHLLFLPLGIQQLED